jgi:hypothetical protein
MAVRSDRLVAGADKVIQPTKRPRNARESKFSRSGDGGCS